MCVRGERDWSSCRFLWLVELRQTPQLSRYIVFAISYDYRAPNIYGGVYPRSHATDPEQSLTYFLYSDQIAIPNLLNFGAMENWGLVTFRESNLLFDRNESSTASRQQVVAVVAHEMVHQVRIS